MGFDVICCKADSREFIGTNITPLIGLDKSGEIIYFSFKEILAINPYGEELCHVSGDG